jgi:hypothetical protein
VLFAIWFVRRVVRRGLLLGDVAGAFIGIWAALFYCQVLVRSDPHHLLTTLPPFFILCAISWRAVLERPGAPRESRSPSLFRVGRVITSALAGSAVVAFLIIVGPFFVPGSLPRTETLQLERAEVRVLGAEYIKEFLNQVQSYAPPRSSILCLPYQPMLYFLCERRNPTRWNYLWPGDQTAADHLALIRQAQADPPAVVVLTGESEMRGYAPEIVNYVHTRYRFASSAFGIFTVYRREDNTRSSGAGAGKTVTPAPP